MGDWQELLTENLTPTEIREMLPIDWVIDKLWDLKVSSTKIICPNPNHKDDTPSFNVWNSTGSGVYTKFGCYGCGWRGDVFDVIQDAYGCTFGEAMDKAIDELLPQYHGDNWTGGEDTRPVVTQEELEAHYNDIVSWGQVEYTLHKFMRAKGMIHIVEYAQEEWKWRGHAGYVSIPHYDNQQRITGVKFRDPRDLARKWGILGSHYVEPYGIWRDQGHENVVLCEGETDTVWAAYQLQHLQGRNCDVFGIPTGVAQIPPKESLDILRGRKVWIIFDGDEPGKNGAIKWNEALRQTSSHIKQVPWGHDLCDSGVPVATILGLKETHEQE